MTHDHYGYPCDPDRSANRGYTDPFPRGRVAVTPMRRLRNAQGTEGDAEAEGTQKPSEDGTATGVPEVQAPNDRT